jgi:hypothetical protein
MLRNTLKCFRTYVPSIVVLTWADHRVLIPSAIIPLRISLVLLLLAAKLSSTMNLVAFDTDATYFISFSVASTDLKRYLLPNILMTEQNVQS